MINITYLNEAHYNHCSQYFYYSKFKGGLNKHRYVKKKKDGTSQFLPGTPILSVTFDHPMLFYVYAPVDKNGEVTLSTNAVMQNYKNLVSTVPLSHGEVLICQPRDDERYMNALRLKKEDTAKRAESVLRMSFVSWWAVGRGDYYIDGSKDGYPVEHETLE
jgi:hypothetical protein